ncbi:PLP-dependent aminotransferase family protein [Streptomyces sp. RB6PN25]|uniref:PLP-dependent aminotransferase family protein n=1 Tax=Streptomyces humicola TaxID=2953240 RepID=A0ABT1PY23_9ACTN|nr:PLP-dependent aminotransferase family protein [Streptomyces humicola]MCQ4082562.1 PLP-dependent aminotransferase family protein [Streptomyces humicola]
MNERANPGLDLHLDLASDLTSGGGVRAGLEVALREAARDGRLAPGTRLPSSRVLARDLGIARNTVADAYGQLVAEGWLTARQGSGTRVAAPPVPTSRRSSPKDMSPFPDTVAAGEPRLPYDLRPGSPDVSAFPRAAWGAAARRALMAAPNEAFGYGDPRGRIEVREALAAYLARVRGVRSEPGLIMVCSGFMQATGLLARALRALGTRRIAVEEFGFPVTRTILHRSRLEAVQLPVDRGGAQVGLLGNGVSAGAALLTPAHQFPTGAALPPERRTAAVAWARRSGGVVIEDDYDGEFRYDRQPLGALQGLDPTHVVYAGTASKSLAPGLRLAWLALPPRLLEPAVEERRLADRQSSVVDELTLAELITSGAYDRHVRRMRLRYRRRRDRLVAALAECAPRVHVSGIAAGLHAVVELPPDGPAEAEVVERAARRGLALAQMGLFGDSRGSALVVGYGTPPEHAFAGALERLCEVLAEEA